MSGRKWGVGIGLALIVKVPRNAAIWKIKRKNGKTEKRKHEQGQEDETDLWRTTFEPGVVTPAAPAAAEMRAWEQSNPWQLLLLTRLISDIHYDMNVHVAAHIYSGTPHTLHVHDILYMSLVSVHPPHTVWWVTICLTMLMYSICIYLYIYIVLYILYERVCTLSILDINVACLNLVVSCAKSPRIRRGHRANNEMSVGRWVGGRSVSWQQITRHLFAPRSSGHRSSLLLLCSVANIVYRICLLICVWILIEFMCRQQLKGATTVHLSSGVLFFLY